MSETRFEVTPVLGTIVTNMDAVEAHLQEILSQYDGVVFTEESKADAKRLVASLRKDKKGIGDQCREVKKQWMLPYERFEARVKRLQQLYDEPITRINEQVEAFEKKRLDERDREIKAIYADEIGDLAEYLPLYRIRDEKWNNAGTSVKAIRTAMAAAIANVRAGKAAIEAMQSDAVPAALRKYQATLNLPDAIAYINSYEAQKAAILRQEEERHKQEEERRRQAEIERARAEERKRIQEEERIRKEAEAETIKRVQFVDEESAAPLTAPGSCRAVYTVVGTDAELQELEMAMTSLGLYYERKDL